MPIHRFLIMVLTAATLSAVTVASPATAGDLCLDATGGSPPSENAPILIGRNFKVPGPNKCKPFVGLRADVGGAVTGTACTSFDRTYVSFVLVAASVPTDIMTPGHTSFYNARLDLPSNTGFLTRNDTGVDNDSTISAYECRGLYPDNI